MLVGFGYNGFEQLIAKTDDDTLSTDRIVAHPVPIFNGHCQQGDVVDSNEGIILTKIVVKWSSIHLLKDQQVICSSKSCTCCLIKSTESIHQNSVIDVDLHDSEEAYIVTHAGLVVVNKDGCREEVQSEFGDCSVKAVSVGNTHTIVVKDDGSCGKILTIDSTYIYQQMSLYSVCHVTCGKEHILILTDSGEVYSYGIGSRGQLGHGLTDTENDPRIVEALQGIRMAAVSCGGWHSAALSAIGDLYVWGWNESGQLGLPMKSKPMIVMQNKEPNMQRGRYHSQEKLSSESRETDMKLHRESEHETYSPTINRIKLSNKNLLQLENEMTSDKEILCSEVGGESSKDVAIQFAMLPSLLDFPGDISVSKVNCGSRHSAAVLKTGELYTWGWGKYGQLGHGNTQTIDRPTLVTILGSQVIDVICGAWNTVAVCKSLPSQCKS